jgi:hypothetical protein
MKNRILSLLMIAFMGLGSAWAVGTCTVSDVTTTQIASESNRIPDSGAVIVTVKCVADASAGTFPAVSIPVSGFYPSTTMLNSYNLTGMILYEVGRTPGTPSPTANYTATITDTNGFALDLALLTANGSAAAAQLTPIVFTTSSVSYPTVRSALTVQISANLVNSAVVTLDLIFRAIV